ncbi:MAG: MATE family efflux transporter [Capnocytophaga sp.]|nr:MATE family efflux transporter [Capnocytophaga sp.]
MKRRELLEKAPIAKVFLKYALPSIITMCFFGLQNLVDGIVVGNYIGEEALGGVNIIMPLFSVIMVVALTVGIGCQTLVSQGLGANDLPKAQTAMNTGFWGLLVGSVVASVVLYFGMEYFVTFLGADEVLFPHAYAYLKGLVFFIPTMSLCFYFDLMLKSIGKPIVSTLIMSLVVLLNIGLSLFFVLQLGWGVMGTSIATGIAFTIAAFISGSILLRGKSQVRLFQGEFSFPVLWRASYNGSSEGASELSSAISILIINNVIVKIMGAEGVSAFTVLNYINFMGILLFLGISDGMIPVLGYVYGAKQLDRLKQFFRFIAKTNAVIGLVVFIILQFFGEMIISLFLKNAHSHVAEIAHEGLRIFSFVFLINGFNILVTSFFTSIGNALGSIIVASLRGIVFIGLGMLILPQILGEKGIWLTLAFAEYLTLIVTIILLRYTMKKIYK